MPRVVHFEIPADDPERAVKFYEKVFNWSISKWGGPVDYWLASTGPDDVPGINGAITPRMDSGVTTNTIDVPSVDEFTTKILEAGGSVVMPKRPVPGIGYLAYCEDTEGNVFGIMEMDPSAQ
jgi:hypothetical protein